MSSLSLNQYPLHYKHANKMNDVPNCRSVQLLRTTFQDHPVWKPLMKILGSPASSCDFMVVASSTLCNLLLEFSPSKEPILESGAIDLLCSLTHKYEPALVLNGVWGLMVSMYNRLLLKHTNYCLL